jgi:fluoroquinolone transport system permease protein
MLNLLAWDALLLVRYHIVTACVVSLLVMCGFIALVPAEMRTPALLTAFVFLDPAVIGLAFVGALILMEKATNTVAAVAVAPMPERHYVLSKVIALTVLGVATGFVLAYVAAGTSFDPLRLAIALILSNIVAVLTGFALAARARSMNQFMIRALIASVVLYVPLAETFGVASAGVQAALLAIPSQATLFLIRAAFDPGSVADWAEIYGVVYLLAWIALGWFWCLSEYRAAVTTGGR